jgi:hypothetical protein
MIPLAAGMRHLGTGFIALALLVGALGVSVFVTERGVANEIKGFVLLLVAAVLLVGGCVLWELRALRGAIERKDSAT